MQQLMKSMREATMRSGMLDNSGTQLGTEMLDTQFATKMTGLPGGLRRRDRAPARAPDGRRRDAGAGRRRRRARPAPRPTGGRGERCRSRSARPISCAATRTRRAPAEAQSGIPAAFMVAQAAHEIGLGPARDPQRRRQLVAQPVRHQGRRRAGTARSPRSRRPNTSTASRSKVTAKFRAYASYAESFRDYARLMKRARATPTSSLRRTRRRSAQGFAQGLQTRRLRHRPGLRRQADARHQHHAAHAAAVT